MSTIPSTVPTISEFFTMTTAEISKLTAENRQLMELSKDISSNQSNQHLNKPILALAYFVENFKCSNKRAELYDIIFPKLKESLSELFQSTEFNDLSSFIGMIISTVSDTVDLTLGNSKVAWQSLAIGVLDLLLQLDKLLYERLLMDQNNDNDNELDDDVESLYRLKSKLIAILTSDDAKCFPDNFNSIDIAFINKLIFILCGMAEFAVKTIDAKLFVEVWRCILNVLCTRNLSKSVDKLRANQDELTCFAFLSTTVKTCCFCLQNSTKEICEVEASHRVKQFHGKTISFLTTFLQRLADKYPDDKFQGHEDMLNTYLILMRTVRTFAQPNEFLNENSTSGLQKVLFLIYKCKKFTECFFRASIDEFSIELLHFGMEISKKITDIEDSELLQYFMNDEDANLICTFLECFSIGPSSTFNKNQIYKDLIIKLSSLLVKTSKTTNSHIVVRLMVKSILESNSIKRYILIDLWNTWVRYLPEVQCYNLLLFWSTINDKFSIVQPIYLQSVYVKLLIQNLYDSLADSYKLKLRFNKPIMRNVKLYTSLGLHRIAYENQEIIELHSEINALYEYFVMQRTDSAFYKLIEYLRLLETMSETTETTVPDYLIKLWKLDFTHQTNKYSPLIIPLIKISVVYKKVLNNMQHFHILQKLSGITDTLNLKFVLKFEILNYLRHIAIKYFTIEYQNDILKLIRQLFNKNFIDSDPMVRQVAFTVYGHVIVEAQHDNLTPDDITNDESLKKELSNFIAKHNTSKKNLHEQMDYLYKLSTYSSKHECLGLELSAGDDDGFQMDHSIDIRIKEIIDRMQSDTKELIELNRNNKFTKEFSENIKNIRQELMSIK